jgi:hypothetical protein
LYRISRLIALADCYALAPLRSDISVTNSSNNKLNIEEQNGNMNYVEGDKKDMLSKASALIELADESMSSTG